MKEKGIVVNFVINRTAHQFDLVTHKELNHERKTYYCEFCDYQADLRRNIISHIKSIHRERKYPCESCEYRAS